MATRTTIPFVLDSEIGEEVSSAEFFAQAESTIFEVRRELEDAIQHRRPPKYTCCFCGQLVKIRGKSEKETQVKRMHFAHLQDLGDCPIKTGQVLSKEQVLRVKYNGAKESALHKYIKEQVALYLEKNYLASLGVSEVKVERVKLDESGLLNWRKPDVSAQYKLQSLVFEIQLSTTFLSVIADREYFYKQNNTFVIWLFRRFSTEADKQRFTDKDVFYSNNRNAFIFDESAAEESAKRQDLVLKCIYQEPYRQGQTVLYNWQQHFVGLDELTFEPVTFKVYFYDVNRQYLQLKAQIETEERQQQQRAIEAAEREATLYEKLNANKQAQEAEYERVRNHLRQLIKLQQFDQMKNLLINEFYNFSESTFDRLTPLLGEGYKATSEDKAFITSAFDREMKQRSHHERNDLLTCLCLAICFIKMNKPNKVYRADRVKVAIFLVLSVKLKCPVGFKFNNLINIAHTVLPGQERYAHLFFKALDTYEGWQMLNTEDRTGKFAAKVRDYNHKGGHSDHSYDKDVFEVLFPDMFSNMTELK